jgi:hypothetical protein
MAGISGTIPEHRSAQMDYPEHITVEVFDWSHDMYGNPTANFLLLWSNGKIGAEWKGGRYRSKRRAQVGYRDKVSEGALAKVHSLFPKTAWRIDDAGITGDRPGGSASFTVVQERN